MNNQVITMVVDNDKNSENKVEDHLIVDIVDDNNQDGKTQQQHNQKTDHTSNRRNSEIYHDDEFDRQFLHRVIADTGRWAFGTVLVEVWVLSEDNCFLYRPESGWWLDPIIHQNCSGTDNCKLCKIIDSETTLAPGIGLPGALWSEAQSGNAVDNMKTQGTVAAIAKSMRSGTTQGVNDSIHTHSSSGGVTKPRKVHWREVKALSDDPDQPWNPRLQLLADVGLGLAAGVPFNTGGIQGIVVYMARETSDPIKLRDPVNESYLMHATMLIGAAYSLREPREAVVKARRNDRDSAIANVKLKMRAFIRMGKKFDDLMDESTTSKPGKDGTMNEIKVEKLEPNICIKTTNFISGKIKTSIKKFFGANVKAPPPFTWEQTTLTFIAAFCTLLVITTINEQLKSTYGKEYQIVLGPFGALMTLQFGLTAAPASQPRNAILGQLFALVIAHSIGQIKGGFEEYVWIKQSLATALAIAVMVKLGITHPPAGAAALLFANGARTWQMVAMMLMANVVAILLAALFNNLHDKRQYPTFWGFRPIRKLICGKDDTKKA